jgi:peptidoglycan/LPS O-acetylase OafA/YrhL
MQDVASNVEAVPAPRTPNDHSRTRWLDGIRFAAALFVVIHHCWLSAFPAFPKNTAPAYLGWMLYGHLAVVVFIVVSGYSLTLAPARNGFRLKGGSATFARRRAWRILPPYWAALIISIVVFAFVTQPATSPTTVMKSFVVHGLLLQDVIGSPSPNGSFWSIAVEAQIYVLFPLMLLLRRRYGPLFAATVVLVSASVLEIAAHQISVLARYDNLTPQLAIDFAFGMAAAGSARTFQFRDRRVPVLGISAVLCAAGIFAIYRIGSQTVVAQYFWVDIVAGAIAALAFRGFATTDHSSVRRVLESRPMVKGGSFSYSIYLIHVIVLDLAERYVVHPLHLSQLNTLWALLAVVVPCALIVSYLFFVVFERPFLQVRSAEALRTYFSRSVKPPVVPDSELKSSPA